MTAQVVTRQARAIARPLKVLVPLIQSELQQGNSAGREHYTNAGTMLNEAKNQVPHGRWSAWLARNFDLSQRTAQDYMRWAREAAQIRGGAAPFSSMRQMTGHTARLREERRSTQNQAFKKVLRDIARDTAHHIRGGITELRAVCVRYGVANWWNSETHSVAPLWIGRPG